MMPSDMLVIASAIATTRNDMAIGVHTGWITDSFADCCRKINKGIWIIINHFNAYVTKHCIIPHQLNIPLPILDNAYNINL